MPSPVASFDALRALSALFLLRALRPVFIMAGVVIIATYALTIILALSLSGWWLLLLVALVPLTFVVIGVGLLMLFFLQRLLPRKLSSDERDQLNAFTDRLFGVAEKAKTPYPILLFLVAKDVARGRESSFLRGLIGESRGLMKDFGAIQDIFKR